MIFESHAHYDDARFDEDRNTLLVNLPEQGIDLVINVGADYNSSKASIALSEQYDYIYAAIGVHPHDTNQMNEDVLQWLETQSQHRKVVAIGEIGLDYYYEHATRAVQQLWFERQIELAKDKKLPIIIHSRDAAKDTMDIIKATNAQAVGGVVHCYSYSLEMASEFADMGFYVGIGGVVTFKNAKKLKEVARYLPLKHLLIETDSPYLAPVPYRGERNDSTYLTYIAQAIANLKGITYEEVIKQTNQNARTLFGIE